VNLGKIARQIRRETVANPKKAGVLGLMALVALYFWAPLIVKWCSGDAPTPIAAAQPGGAATPQGPSAQPSAAALSSAAAQAKVEKPQHAWHEWVTRMEADPQTRPAGPLAANCDPFRQTVKPKAVVPIQSPPTPAAPDVSPESLKIALAGTIVSQNHRVARINGRTYAVGDAVEAAGKDGKPLEFVVKEIDARRVVLQRMGKQYELKTQSSSQVGRIELFGSVE
jgi:hypothetical protein